MSPKLALAVTLLYITWLFIGEHKRGNPFSSAMWIPLLWLVILGSRPVSLWFSNAQLTGNAIDGSPFDRDIFLVLIVAGLLVLVRRRVSLSDFLRNNKLLVVFFAYLGLSVLWSDFTFIAFKRWIKDVGNIVIVLVVLTESHPGTAIRALLTRCAYILIPLSALVIRYFPDVGRYYDMFTWSYSYGGVTLDKNNLGTSLLVCSIGLSATFWECRRRGRPIGFLLVFAMLTLYVFHVANCSTALVSSFLAVSILSLLQMTEIQIRAERLGFYVLGAVVCLLVAQFAFGFAGMLVGLMGRNLTFTGRTDIWEIALSVHTNPLFGVGYWSFWMGDRVDWLALGYPSPLLEAHNGYIETYLNSGIIGVVLLLALLLVCLQRAGRNVRHGSEMARLQLAIIVSLMAHNFTESIFDRFSPIWFVALIALVQYPQPIGAGEEERVSESGNLEFEDAGGPPDEKTLVGQMPSVSTATNEQNELGQIQ